MYMKKIAFCFLIYDIINHEELWNYFFLNIDHSKYQIYIHYKVNIPMKYFESCKLDKCIETKYADVSLIHAHNLLFKKAYEDGCDKIISLSQACIPFKSFNYIYDFLTKDDYGHFNVTPQSQCFPRCNLLIKYYEMPHIQKSSNWFILNRATAEKIVNYDSAQINLEYGNISSPEEHFYITLIHKYGLDNRIKMTPNLANGATTFTNWAGMDYKYPCFQRLKEYSVISMEEIDHLLKSPCLFGRKFNRECIQSLVNRLYMTKINDDHKDFIK